MALCGNGNISFPTHAHTCTTNARRKYQLVHYSAVYGGSLYQCADCGAPINQSMSDEVKVLVFLLAKTFDPVLYVSANCNVCTGVCVRAH